jgi:hypothetical protein
VGGLSPRLRTPQPRSDTASRISSRTFWYAGCKRSAARRFRGDCTPRPHARPAWTSSGIRWIAKPPTRRPVAADSTRRLPGVIATTTILVGGGLVAKRRRRSGWTRVQPRSHAFCSWTPRARRARRTVSAWAPKRGPIRARERPCWYRRMAWSICSLSSPERARLPGMLVVPTHPPTFLGRRIPRKGNGTCHLVVMCPGAVAASVGSGDRGDAAVRREASCECVRAVGEPPRESY